MARDNEPTHPEPTFVIRSPRPAWADSASRGFAERLALFVSGVDRVNSAELLSGLSGGSLKRATACAVDARSWDSATRQGRMAVAFGVQPDAANRLKDLLFAASPTMRLAIYRRLAPWQRSLFPSLELRSELTVAPAMEELAQRLIREATR